MVNLSHIRSKAEFIGSLQPAAKQGFAAQESSSLCSDHIDLMVADAVRTVAYAVADQQLSRRLLEYSRDMAKQAVTALSLARKSDTEFYPPWPWPWTARDPWIESAPPAPQVPQRSRAAEHIELARILIHLAGVTSNKEHSRMLQSFALAIREKFGAAGLSRTVAASALLP